MARLTLARKIEGDCENSTLRPLSRFSLAFVEGVLAAKKHFSSNATPMQYISWGRCLPGSQTSTKVSRRYCGSFFGFPG